MKNDFFILFYFIRRNELMIDEGYLPH